MRILLPIFIMTAMLVTVIGGAVFMGKVTAEPAFITVAGTGVTYTHEEYHTRVRVQLEEWGATTVCDWHLGNLVRPHHAVRVWQEQDKEAIGNAWRSIEVYNEECNDVSSGRRPLG